MKASVAFTAFMLAGVAQAADKPMPVLVTNPSVSIRDADAGLYTHVGQKPSQLVALGFNRESGGRIDPANGNSLYFEVPAGYVFVLTDIAWYAGCTADTLIRFTLVRHKGPGDFDRPISGQASCIGGYATFERHYTTGQVFGAGQSFTADAVFGLSATPTVGVFAEAHGYLVPAN